LEDEGDARNGWLIKTRTKVFGRVFLIKIYGNFDIHCQQMAKRHVYGQGHNKTTNLNSFWLVGSVNAMAIYENDGKT
jgi:hypothetical protein